MSAAIIDGRALASGVYDELDKRIAALRTEGILPRIAIILVGNDEMSKKHVNLKEKAATAHGMECVVWHLSGDVSEQRLIALIETLNRDDSIHGLIVQMPLPEHLDTKLILDAIEPSKDIDGLHFCNAGKLLNKTPSIVACTPRAIMKMLDSINIELDTKHTVVVGKSNLVGRPIAICLLNSNATVSVCHTRTQNLADITRSADVLIVAAGSAGLITADMVKDGAVVIDVGQTNIDGKLYGDVVFDEVASKASYITKPVGGVGPMTVAMLMTNLVDCAEMRLHAR